MSDPVEVLSLIRSAFPPEPFAGAVTGGCYCDECKDVDKALSQRRWDDLSDETVNTEFGCLPLLSGEGFQAFLPAWMTRSLDNFDSGNYNIREWTLYELAIYVDSDDPPEESATKIEWLRRRLEYLISEQAASVRAFLASTLPTTRRLSPLARKSANHAPYQFFGSRSRIAALSSILSSR
jgi:hypothetical protein